ncbi:uncharacterized protein ccdc142 isoform X1 [Rhinichthys klamathensis goyatoka]|uniref:uncharacterized protein ccdc142 isoform X1 n=2 Tax=Rhinichthys klamathensis goyatoka TaxID=3034132 RepID=UPI0024B5D7D0|nr:uncharacterized protein ccdc142 isoform X1 [Rhinichthys klamathensis goyatoka]
MAQSIGGSQEEHTYTHTDKTDSSAADGPDNQRPDHGQSRPSDLSEILPEEYISNGKYDASWYQGPFTKSLQRAEALFRTRLNPSLKWLMGQKSRDGSWDSESESCSSRSVQRLGPALQSLGSQCLTLRDPASGARPFGCVTNLSLSSCPEEFHHHSQASAFSQHYCQLQQLMEQRSQLLFLSEYARRTHLASCFVTQLGLVLERTRLLLADRGQPNSTWSLSLKALCLEMQVHVNHWDLLRTKARTDRGLRRVLFIRVETLASMRRTLNLLGSQAVWLMEQCIHTALRALAEAQPDRVPRDALVDLLCAVELFNQILQDKRSSGLDSGARPFPVERLMMILARSQAKKAAEQLYTWSSQQSNLIHIANNPRCVSSPAIHTHTEAAVDEASRKPVHSLWSSNLPFASFISRDRECLDTLFQVLVTSTNLLAPHIPRKPALDLEDSMVICRRASEGEERPLSRPRMPCRTISVDLGRMKLFSHYKDLLWREFGEAVARHFHCQSCSCALGSLNLWSDETLMLLVSWLRHACVEDLVPEECKESLSSFCSHVLSTAAFSRWDEMMCVSLGSGLKEKCVPAVKHERCVVRTATMDLILQLFPPLHTVLKLLPGERGSRSLRETHLGLLCRSVVTVQASTLWVMSKAYQFLASWSLSKFLLVTQGDLKDLKDSVESLVQLAAAVGRDSDQRLVVQHTASLAQALTHLQAFSDLVLRTFSMDCKKMSVEIFQQTMPSAKHWRISHRTELPSRPSEYAACAAQSVIGQVMESIQTLPDEARVPALAEATTAFMEAWMEHILTQKIKFSIQGALQLKQDFDSIRDLVRSEEYRLSEELLQKLLSLRVFHQVDSAIVCLLQQPVAKPYLPSRSWEPFRHCCPNSAQVMDQAAGALHNLESMDVQAAWHQALTRAESSLTPDLLTPPPESCESYLASAQQEWLDLRIHTGSRWKLPGLQCFSRAEP